jgi:hypothetical protein
MLNFIGDLFDNQLIKLLEKYPDKSWKWYGISLNPNITMKFITDNPDKSWDWYEISMNRFNKNPIIHKGIDERIKFREECYTLLSNRIIKYIAYMIVMYL